MSNLKSVAVTVLELLAFNSHDRPLRTDRQRHTHRDIERTHYLRHSLRSLGGDKYLFKYVLRSANEEMLWLIAHSL